MELEQLGLGLSKPRYEAERSFIRQWLASAPDLTLLALEVPTLTDLAREASVFLREQGLCLSFRMGSGDDADCQRLCRALWKLWAKEPAPQTPTVWDLMDRQPEKDCFLLVSQAEQLTCDMPLGEFLLDLLSHCSPMLHVVMMAEYAIPLLSQAEDLPRLAAAVTPGALVQDTGAITAVLQEAYPGLSELDCQSVCQHCGGWISALDAAVANLTAQQEQRTDAASDEPTCFAPEVSALLEQWVSFWPETYLSCLERLCVCREAPEKLAERLAGEAFSTLLLLAQTGFPLRACGAPEPTYTLNPVFQTWLYHRTGQTRGRGFLLEQHKIAAEYHLETENWPEVFRHQLSRGYVEEAAKVMRYLAFSDLDPTQLEAYRSLLRKQQPAAMDRLPWVQFGYAIAVKYRYPNIAFRCLDRALELFEAAEDHVGIVLVCCQKISLGFFATEQKSMLEEALRILTENSFDIDQLDPILDGYRKVFTAYALLQQGNTGSQTIDLLEQARESAIIRNDRNLRLWACFVLILAYKQDIRYTAGLSAVLNEAMELAESHHVQKSLKMCLYQTVAFLCFVEGGRYGEACSCCEKAIRIADAIEATGYSVYINMIHAYALDCLGRYAKAEQVILDTARKSNSILNVRNEHLLAYYFIGQSYHYFSKGDWGLALDTAEKAVRYAVRSGRTSYLARSLLALGNILAEHDLCDRAQALACQCLDLCAQQEKYRFYSISARFLQAQVLKKQNRCGDFEEVMAALAEESKNAGIFHYNFAKPSVISGLCQGYTPPEQHRRFFMQLQSCNTVRTHSGEAPILTQIRATTPLEVCILGPLQVFSDGQRLDACASARAGQLLRLLALDGSPLSVHKLLEAIWPEWDEKAAMNSFYFTLYQLRSYLNMKDAILYRRSQCSLNPALVTVDAVLFRELIQSARQYLRADNLYAASRYYDQALVLCRGPVLDGDDLPEDFVLQQEDLERNMYAAMREYGSVCLRQHMADKAERILSRAMQNTFADEGAARLLMLAQYLSGNKSGALSTYERLCRLLQTELGVEPHRLTNSLIDRIRRNQEVTDLFQEAQSLF
ncbi:BTAD domain-containing putative transcriptional regulator [uncultured Oscillibacter sp.]|uniref:AfsR/SARP family transcriptional regulator n=1 Tax=uncultured Oscillibacter sp. TaxID=876091 RepID=UPI0025EED0C9|nr:BTAD domain-containing putative transcriptional regulator [uncultured Oscillibacter sp.]